ncbi:GAF domain-containing protein [Thermodesulfobacteriota bacterium]
MAKPTYEQLEKRVAELELLIGRTFDREMSEEEREIYELSVLCNISEALASTRDLDALLDIVINEANKALLTEGAGVLLYDENRNDLYWRILHDKREILDAQKAELRLPLDQSIAGWVYQNNKPARVNDTSKDPRYYPDMTRKSGFEIRKVMQVPLNTREKTIGVLMVMNKIGGDFSEQDEALGVSMASIIALAIENATVYQKLRKSRDDLDMLYKSSLALATTMDLDHLLEFVLDELNGTMQTEVSGVLLYDEANSDLYWRVVQDQTGLIDTEDSRLRLPLERSISGRVFKTGEPALLNDPSGDPLFFSPFEARTGFHIRNEMIVPLNTREETIGVLIVINRKDGQFSDEDLYVCSSLAGVVAMAVENAQFFDELLTSYRQLEDMYKVKSKILNHLSHELRTPLAIVRGTLATMEKRLAKKGIAGFDRAMARMNRQIQSLNRLESQVESIMRTGYLRQRQLISGFLDKALTLMDVQGERTPEIQNAANTIRSWLEKTFPTRRDELELVNVKEFGESVYDYVMSKAKEQKRTLTLEFQLDNHAEILIPKHVLEAIMEGLIRNAIEATPDNGKVKVSGHVAEGTYSFTVKDTGIGIPEKDKELIFEGFYPVQDTEDYSSRRPYSFNAGGKGIDLLRIRMFSELYGLKLSFSSERCRHLLDSQLEFPGNVDHCPHCQELSDCYTCGGSTFVVDFPLADGKTPADLQTNPS